MLRAALLACGLLLVPAGSLPSAAPATAPSTPADSGLSEAALWLRDYLRIDTTNPPGGERQSAAFLASILHRAGIPTRTFFTPEGRASLYARLPATVAGQGSATSLVLLHHMDVVAPGPGWTVDPFGGTVAEGRLWGRGAVDAKSLGIAHLAALIDLQRSRTPRHRDVVFLAVADEESGGAQGTGWLLDHHPELFEDVAAVLNEGGANLVLRGNLQWWGIEVAQKRPLWLEVTATAGGTSRTGRVSS